MKLVRFLFFPFAVLYDLITTARNLFFNIGIFKQRLFKIPLLIVGNLNVGGTGKTPQIEYLIRLLKSNYKIAVLSRGYKRKTKGYILLNNTHSVLDVGDEPLQFFKKFKDINVAVSANRVMAIKTLIKEKSPDLILLDDAYQHRKVKGSFYILLTKFNDLFVDDFLLPTGNLRESSRGAKRANIIVVTKCPINLETHQQKKILQKLKKYKKEVFFSAISYADVLKGSLKIPVNNLKEYKILLITGIAKPEMLLAYLNEKKINVTHLQFSDHHNFSDDEILEIETKFKAISSNKKIILTTEKDFVRLEPKLKKVSYLEIETKFIGNNKERFNNLINAHIKATT